MERPCRPVSHGECLHPGLAILGAIQTVTQRLWAEVGTLWCALCCLLAPRVSAPSAKTTSVSAKC